MPISQENYTVEYLIKMIKENNVKEVKEWLDINREKQAKSQGYDLTLCYGRGLLEEPVLFTAIRQKNLEIFSMIVEENKNDLSKLRKRSGDTLLHLIVIKEWADGLRFIVETCKDFISGAEFFSTGSPIFAYLLKQINSLEKRNDSLEILDLLLNLDKIDYLLDKEASKLAFEKINDQDLKRIVAQKISKNFRINPYVKYSLSVTKNDDKEEKLADSQLQKKLTFVFFKELENNYFDFNSYKKIKNKEQINFFNLFKSPSKQEIKKRIAYKFDEEECSKTPLVMAETLKK